jgi:hypothetical protein
VATVEKEKVEKHCWCTETKKICVPKVVCPWSKGGSGLTLFSFLKNRGGCCGDAYCSDACGCCNNGCCGNGCGCMKPRCGKVICVRDLKKKTYECEKCVCKWEIRRLPACCGQGCCRRSGCNDCECADCCGCGDVYEGIDSSPAATPQEAPAPSPAATPDASAALRPVEGLHFFNAGQW